MNRFANIVSVIALVVALTSAGAWARTLITGKDIRNNSLTTQDVRTSTLRSSDVAANTITPNDVSFPEPQETTPDLLSGPVSSQLAPLGTLSVYNKENAAATLEVQLSGAVASGPATNCVFQLRVNQNAPSKGGGEVFAQGQPVNVSTAALFEEIPAGPVNIELWARANAFVPGGPASGPTCILGPATPGIETTVLVTEVVE